jgi:hypothetical protein
VKCCRNARQGSKHCLACDRAYSGALRDFERNCFGLVGSNLSWVCEHADLLYAGGRGLTDHSFRIILILVAHVQLGKFELGFRCTWTDFILWCMPATKYLSVGSQCPCNTQGRRMKQCKPVGRIRIP